MKRRELTAALLSGGLVATQAAAQSSAPQSSAQQTPAPIPPPDDLTRAKERVKRTGEALRRMPVDVCAEPAFQFKAL